MASLITGKASALSVKARQKLKTPEQAEAFNDDLLGKIGDLGTSNDNIAFEDFDVSQNPLPYDQYEALFSTLTTTAVRVERVRMFGCSTMNDSAAALLANWLSSVTTETAPYEMHLSDCALTAEGFQVIMDAIEGNDAFPCVKPGSSVRTPVYLRLEQNFIDPESIQEKIDSGALMTFSKRDFPAASAYGDAKVRLLVNRTNDAKFGQKEGTPPEPEDAPPPKPVFDKWNPDPGQKGAGAWQQPWAATSQWAGNGWNTGGWPSGKGNAMPAARPMVIQPAMGKGKPAVIRPAMQALPAKGGVKAAAKGIAKGGIRPTMLAPSMVKGGKAAPAAIRPATVITPAASKGTTSIKGSAFKGSTKGSAKGVHGSVSQVIAPKVIVPQGKGNLKGATATIKPAAAKGAGKTSGKSKSAAPPATPPPGNGMRPGWEEHWSEDYGIPYFWNATSGESLWEKPT